MLKMIMSLLFFAQFVQASEPSHGGAPKAPLFPPKIADRSLATRPTTPELLEPAFMAPIAGNSVTLKWKEMQTITNFHLQIATDPNFKWLVVNEPQYTTTSFEAKNLEPGKHYYWRVAAQKSNNDAGYSKGAFAKSMFQTK